MKSIWHAERAEQLLWDMIADQNREMASLHFEIKRLKYLVRPTKHTVISPNSR
jgi:hypothetical protein